MDVVRRSGCRLPHARSGRHAAFGFQGLSASPTNTSAGAHSNFNIHIGFTSPSADVKDLTVGLPPGLVGNPTATPLCTSAQLQSDSCPSASQAGTVSTNVTVHLLGLLPLPMTVNGSLYNLEPQAGQPARFGIVLRPIAADPIPLLQKIKQASDVRLRQRATSGWTPCSRTSPTRPTPSAGCSPSRSISTRLTST
jgi:hypothetical protein